MRIRSIKPEFYRSEDIAALDWDTRLIFIGLWSYVDDNGVGRDVEQLIVADLFPLEDDPRETIARVSRGLRTLSERELIIRYTVDNRPFLAISTWATHQRIDKPNKPRYPGPDQGILSDLRESRETLATSQRLEQGNRGAEEQRNRGTVTSAPAVLDDEIFNEVWSHWPKKDDKKDALAKWPKAVKESRLPERELADIAMAHGDAYRQFKTKQFTPALVVWLNKGRWDNELPAPEVVQPPVGRVTAGQKARSIADDFRRDGL